MVDIWRRQNGQRRSATSRWSWRRNECLHPWQTSTMLLHGMRCGLKAYQYILRWVFRFIDKTIWRNVFKDIWGVDVIEFSKACLMSTECVQFIAIFWHKQNGENPLRFSNSLTVIFGWPVFNLLGWRREGQLGFSVWYHIFISALLASDFATFLNSLFCILIARNRTSAWACRLPLPVKVFLVKVCFYVIRLWVLRCAIPCGSLFPYLHVLFIRLQNSIAVAVVTEFNCNNCRTLRIEWRSCGENLLIIKSLLNGWRFVFWFASCGMVSFVRKWSSEARQIASVVFSDAKLHRKLYDFWANVAQFRIF